MNTANPGTKAGAVNYAVGVTVTFAVVDRQRGLIHRVSPSFMLVPLIIPFYSLAALKATTEYLFSWEGD